MDVRIVGGGPAGLYASLLLKKEHPDWELTVYERDPVDNTYGWGVVFSDATLGNLREADKDSHERITDAFARWNPIDVYYGDEYFRCGGHTYAGIMRADLLRILQERCREVGVDLHHETTIEDPDDLRAESDLLVGADGLNSVVREAYAERFQPSIDYGDAKFVWLGTEKPFDVFTFVFRENEHGLWRVHAYPGRKSTFIVECTEETWTAAGMDQKEEDAALEYFEDLFDDHLGEYGLLSKLYSWRNFPVVECRRWSVDGDVVLVGDAVHTAHFSVGSGTKLAMEDAIALADGFREHGEDTESALNWYEKERKPRTEGLQEAAARSQSYFENIERYDHFAPRKFAYNLLTRSGRINYEDLKIRDPSFADDFDRWFASAEGDAGGENPVVAEPPVFQPLALRDIRVRNRAVVTPPPASTAVNGEPSEEYRDRLVEFGRSGAGLVLTDPVAVTSNGRITPGTPGLYDADHVSRWASVTESIEHRETAAGITLCHAGRRGSMRPRRYGLDRPLPDDESWELYAPSPTPYTPDGIVPTAMDEEEMARIRDAFVTAAERAHGAGFDYAQLHVGHGYLLSSFLSPLVNDRDDEYGGSLENRLRYPLEVFDAVRGAWPDEKPLGITLQATDWNLQGFKSHEAVVAANRFAEHGCDLFEVVAGQATYRERPRYSPTTLVDFSERIRNEAEVRTLSTNYVTTVDEMNTAVGAGRADLCTYRGLV